MRFCLNLSVDPNQNCLPLNYQYEFSSWLYKCIEQGDPNFSKWLHDNGYGTGNKRFKLFTFSNIFVQPKWKILSDRMLIYSGKAQQQISFYLNEALTPLLSGMFQEESFTIGDTKSRACFTINSIHTMSPPVLTKQMTFLCKSPVCLSKTVEDKKTPEYISPELENYQEYLFNNLIAKYKAVYSECPKWNKKDFSWRLIGKIKSRLITIKSNSKSETKIRGYQYKFSISAPVELIKIGYYAGFGEKNTLGFGFVEEI